MPRYRHPGRRNETATIVFEVKNLHAEGGKYQLKLADAKPTRSDQPGQNLVEVCFWHNAGGSFGFAFGVDEDPGWLCRNAEVGVERVIEIGQVGEGELVLGDEALEGLVIARPCHANDGDFASELLCDRLDRGGFGIARASRGGPKPECGWFARELGTVDCPTAYLDGLEI